MESLPADLLAISRRFTFETVGLKGHWGLLSDLESFWREHLLKQMWRPTMQEPRLFAWSTQTQLKHPPALPSWRLCSSWTRASPSNQCQMRHLQLPQAILNTQCQLLKLQPLQAFSIQTSGSHQLEDPILFQSYRGTLQRSSAYHQYKIIASTLKTPNGHSNSGMILRPASAIVSAPPAPSPVARLANYAKSVALTPGQNWKEKTCCHRGSM